MLKQRQKKIILSPSVNEYSNHFSLNTENLTARELARFRGMTAYLMVRDKVFPHSIYYGSLEKNITTVGCSILAIPFKRPMHSVLCYIRTRTY